MIAARSILYAKGAEISSNTKAPFLHLTIPALSIERDAFSRLTAMALESIAIPDEQSVYDAISQLIGRKGKWISVVAKNYSRTFLGRTRPTKNNIVEWLLSSQPFQNALSRGIAISGKLTTENNIGTGVRCLASLKLPVIQNAMELCQFLELDSIDELEWLVAPNKWTGLKLQHYHTKLFKKRTGQYRLVEAPRSRLKFVQRKILHGILDLVPVSDACFGFVKNRNVRQFASVHCSQGTVLRMDLEGFFPNIATGRVHSMWRTIGYPDEVAKYLTWLCTIPPKDMSYDEMGAIPEIHRMAILEQCKRHRLPQGAPSSGAIANLIAYRLDRRFIGFAKTTGGRYSRYADDLAFSWPKLGELHAKQIATWIAATIMECGFRVNFRKTRIMRRDQRKSIAGIIVNEQPNVNRTELGNLRALLFNCVRFGPTAQNRAAHANFKEHLRGRIGWVLHIKPAAGLRLMKIYDRIVW